MSSFNTIKQTIASSWDITIWLKAELNPLIIQIGLMSQLDTFSNA